MKKGFTLAEMLIALTIIGVMSSIIMTVMSVNMSTTTKIQYKNAFSLVSQSVSDIITNQTAFPQGLLTNNGTVNDGGMFGSVSYALCNTFIGDVNTVSTNATCSGSVPSSVPNRPNFTTTNGMKWYGFDQDFTPDDGSMVGNMTVKVDVDGKGVNILPIQIYTTGKLDPAGNSTAISYLTN